MKKERLDRLVVAAGFAESREQAQRLIMSGKVRIGDEPVTKAGVKYPVDVVLRCDSASRFVGRGAEKLQAAFERFDISVEGKICLDIGASTGGFTDCMLQHGALKVYAIDVGKGQLHWKLRNDARVVVMEKVNARYLTRDQIQDTASFASIDVSFISLTRILPAAIGVLAKDAQLVTLVKPQFEAGRRQVGKGGVVREQAIRDEVLVRIRAFGEDAGLKWLGCVESPLRGPAGNVEYLAWWQITTAVGSTERRDGGGE